MRTLPTSTTCERGLYAMFITVAEVCFFYADKNRGESVTRVRAAFRDASAAEVWAFNSKARLTQAREEWNEAFGPAPSLCWEGVEINFHEIPLC